MPGISNGNDMSFMLERATCFKTEYIIMNSK